MAGTVSTINENLLLFVESFVDHFEPCLVTYCLMLQQIPPKNVTSMLVSDISVLYPTHALCEAAKRLGQLVDKLYLNKSRSKWTKTKDACDWIMDLNRRSANEYRKILLEVAAGLYQNYEKEFRDVDEGVLRRYAMDVVEVIIKYYVTPGAQMIFDKKTMIDAVTTSLNTSGGKSKSNSLNEKSIVQCCYGKMFSALLKTEPKVDKSKFVRDFSGNIQNSTKANEAVMNKLEEYFKTRDISESQITEAVENVKQVLLEELGNLKKKCYAFMMEDLVESMEILKSFATKNDEEMEDNIPPADKGPVVKNTSVVSKKIVNWTSNFN